MSIAVDQAHRGTVLLKMSQLYPSKLTKGLLKYGSELIDLGVLCDNWAEHGTCIAPSHATRSLLRLISRACQASAPIG